MISIFYPQEDYDAAEIAIKIQSLAQINNQKVFIVPKHYGRVENIIYNNFMRSEAVIFLMTKKRLIESNTRIEFTQLSKLRKQIYALVPKGTQLPDYQRNLLHVTFFTQSDKDSLVNGINDLIGNIKAKKDSNIIIFTLLILIIVILSLQDKSK